MLVKIQPMRNLDFIIIGAQKSGTSSLRVHLQKFASEIFMPNSELHFWNREQQYQDGNGLDGYLLNFSNAKPQQKIGEKSPSYLASEKAAVRIKSHMPNIKIIAILRDPIDRAYSAYWHGRRVGAISSKRDFASCIRQRNRHAFGDLITQGYYSRHLQIYKDLFSTSGVLILDFQKMLNQDLTELQKINEFLDLKEIINNLDFPHRNVASKSIIPGINEFIFKQMKLDRNIKSKLIKVNLKEFYPPPMLKEDREFLSELYEGEDKKVNSLFGTNFKWTILGSNQ